MLHRVWRLSESGENNLGLSCTEDGLILGRTMLIERRGGRFAVRERIEIERLLSRAYAAGLVADRLMLGLATVAAALNANDPCLARIAAVHLRIPDLPERTARDDMERVDALIKASEIRKASPDDPKHPGWPAGTEGGRGGEFRPKDGSDAALTRKAKDRITRRELRISLLAALHIGVEAAANLIPGVDVAADVAMLADFARTISEFRKLAIDAAAAFDFAKKSPHSFEDLQVSSSGYEDFSSYDQFLKGELSPELMAKRFGRAGDGNQYHHIVTQGGANADNIPPVQLQNTENIIILPMLLHETVNAEYSQFMDNENMTLYQWLQTQPYDAQREVGLENPAGIAYPEIDKSVRLNRPEVVMELDESIVQLGAKLDEWFDGNLATLLSQDRMEQGKALLRGFEIAKEFDRLKAQGLAAITALLNCQDTVVDDERAASLIQGFEFAAKLKATLHDELLDTDGYNKIVGLMDIIASALDASGSGRAALTVLLDHPDARVRASAGAYLINLMPNRVVPILRDIEANEDANSAHFTAYWAILVWEREGKARNKS